MSRSVTERRLVDILMCYFRGTHPTGREVRHYEKRIDVLTINPVSGEVWAIEAKVAAWGRALSQAVVNLAAAQRSYIAIYAENVHRVKMDMLDEHGIGLISVGRQWGDVQIVKEARLSQYTNRLTTQRMRDELAKERP